MSAEARAPQPPLAMDTEAFAHATSLAAHALEAALASGDSPPSSAVAIAVAAIRSGQARGAALMAPLRQLVVRLPPEGEGGLRCLRALVRAGEPVDAQRFAGALARGGRVGRIALAGLAELCSRGSSEAFTLLSASLDGALKADAALWLSHVCSEASLDVLATRVRVPGSVGLHAATALLTAEEDPFAFESLLERLCRADETLAAGLALWGADARGTRLIEAESVLARWARRGVQRARTGRFTAAVLLGARGAGTELAASLKALAGGDALAVHAAQAVWQLGECERARVAAEAMFRRGPLVAARTFAVVCGWADQCDEPALKLVRRVVANRPVELSRAAMLDALSGCRRASLHRPVLSALTGADRALALEAGRAVAARHEPPATVPGQWL